MPLGCHLLLSVARAQEGPRFNILQKEMLVKEGGGGSHRWPGTETCLLIPYVPTVQLSLVTL